jgi:hypothetical protein
MRNFARNRPRFQRQHITDYFNLSGSSHIQVRISNPGSGKVVINDVVQVDSIASGHYFKDIPVEFRAVPDVGYRFIRWEGIDQDSLNPVQVYSEEDSLSIIAVFDATYVSIIPSVVVSDTTLTRDDSPYFATGDIIVDSSTIFRVESGVEIYMPEEANILVYGSLIIEGTEENPVIIAPNEYASVWGALCFLNSNDSSAISYLKITGATTGPDFSRDKAAVTGFNSSFSLTNVTIEDSELPVFIQHGNVSVKGCILRSGTTGDLINVKKAESVVVENCDLRGNDSYDSDAIDYDQMSNGIIRGNRIYNFYGYNSDAIDLGEGTTDVLIENNIIYNINDKGVSIGKGSTATVKRNLIANCGQGIGIKDFGSYGSIEHNTFYANQYGIACFEKNIGSGGGNADVVNCIIADSRMGSVYLDKLSTMDLSYSLVNKDKPAGLHNIYDEPGFANNFHLTANSPAINAGNPTLPMDPDGSLPDMGAFPFEENQGPDLRITEIHYHPSEGKTHEFIEILNAGSSEVNLKGMELSGDVKYIFPEETIFSGELFLVAMDRTQYQEQGFKVFQWDKGELTDEAGSILLLDSQGNRIDYVHYNSRYWWPIEGDGSGPSLELHDASLENMLSSNWRSSYSHGGTPGRAAQSELLSGIYINEFMASNNSIFSDEYGDYDDWIELYNDTDKPVNVAGLYVTDDLSNPLKYRIPLYDLSSTFIPAKGFLLLWADGETEEGALHLGFRLDQNGESIGMVQPYEGKAWFLDSLSYFSQATNNSYGRYPDGSVFHPLTEPTPLASNIFTGTRQGSEKPFNFTLFQNHPNPFNTSTTIRYQLTSSSYMELRIYDMFGRIIFTLDNGIKPSGIHQFQWNTTDLQSGIYFCELKTSYYRQVIKMILTR